MIVLIFSPDFSKEGSDLFMANCINWSLASCDSPAYVSEKPGIIGDVKFRKILAGTELEVKRMMLRLSETADFHFNTELDKTYITDPSISFSKNAERSLMVVYEMIKEEKDSGFEEAILIPLCSNRRGCNILAKVTAKGEGFNVFSP